MTLAVKFGERDRIIWIKFAVFGSWAAHAGTFLVATSYAEVSLLLIPIQQTLASGHKRRAIRGLGVRCVHTQGLGRYESDSRDLHDQKT